MSKVTRRAKEARERSLFGARRALRWRPSLPNLRRGSRLGFPTTLKLLVAGFVIVSLAVGVNGWLDGVRRTAEAPIEVLSLDSTARPHPTVPGGIDIRYRFVANGASYEFSAFRPWSLETIHQAKVCYDPADPANQILVKASETCG